MYKIYHLLKLRSPTEKEGRTVHLIFFYFSVARILRSWQYAMICGETLGVALYVSFSYTPSPNILKIYGIEIKGIDDALEFLLYQKAITAAMCWH